MLNKRWPLSFTSPSARSTAAFLGVAAAVLTITIGTSTVLGNAATGGPDVVAATGVDADEGPALGRGQAPKHVQEFMRGNEYIAKKVGVRRVAEAMDVLAHTRNRVLMGFVADDAFCTATYLRSSKVDVGAHCAPLTAPNELWLHRATDLNDLSGNRGGAFLAGEAPTGTTEVVLQSADGKQATVKAYSAGKEWQRSFFVADWPGDLDTTVVALDRDGLELARKSSAGLRTGPEPDAG